MASRVQARRVVGAFLAIYQDDVEALRGALEVALISGSGARCGLLDRLFDLELLDEFFSGELDRDLFQCVVKISLLGFAVLMQRGACVRELFSVGAPTKLWTTSEEPFEAVRPLPCDVFLLR